MTARLQLISHASTSGLRTSSFPADEPLDDQGRRQLAGLPPRRRFADRNLTSPALRAVQTAEALKLDAIVEPVLRDCDFGRWTGRTLEEVQNEEPESVSAWLRDPAAAPHGGESVLALIARVSDWLDAQRAAPGKTIAVTHPLVIRAAIVHAIEAGPRSFWRLDVAPLSQVQLSANKDRWNFVSLAAMDLKT